MSCSANTDDMYARFLAGPDVIAKARRSDSGGASRAGSEAGAADVLAHKQAEAAAMAEANPYAAFSGISEAGLQSSVFEAPVRRFSTMTCGFDPLKYVCLAWLPKSALAAGCC